MSKKIVNQIISLINVSAKERLIKEKMSSQVAGVVDIIRFREIEFDIDTNQLFFIVEHYHRQPKITGYITRNYVRTPIYGDYSERSKIIKKFNKKINPLKFVNEEINNLNLPKKLVLQLIEEIGVIPEWRQKEIDLERIEIQINKIRKTIKNFEKEKSHYKFKQTDLIEKADKLWIRILFLIPTFGLSFFNFISKKRAKINAEINIQNKAWNKNHKEKIDEKNKKLWKAIEQFNEQQYQKIISLGKEYEDILKREINVIPIEEEGWIDLKSAFNFSNSKLKNQKGIYIIWNKTKNKHYVGQSKNIGRQIFNHHFNNGQVKNIIFAKDWYNGDEFKYKYIISESSDENELLKKHYIELYDAFENGYNSTS